MDFALSDALSPKIDRTITRKSEEERLKESCNDFESIFLNMMLKSMRKTLTGDAVFGKDHAMEIYESMQDQYLVEDISKGTGAVGVGDVLYEELSRKAGFTGKGDFDPLRINNK